MSFGAQKTGLAALLIGVLALCACMVVINTDNATETIREVDAKHAALIPEDDFVQESDIADADAAADAVEAAGGSEADATAEGGAETEADAAAEESEEPLAGESGVRTRIQKAIETASKALESAHGEKEKAAAKDAVRAALADAGVADADNAGTVAWASRNLVVSKEWAEKALKTDAEALGDVAAWTEGDRALGAKYKKKCERAIQSMIAVAEATKNKEMVAREAKLREEGKMKRYDAAITNAREASDFAGQSVAKAREALALTMGTKTRIAAKHALQRAQDALTDANDILKLELNKKDVVTSSRLREEGGRLVGENEIHFSARQTFHKANRVLKLVESALAIADKNHNAHKEATMKREQKVTMEKATKLADKERHAKSEAKRKALGIETKEEYAAYLAKEALKYGQVARDDAKKAAEAGKLASEKAAESAHVKESLGVKNVTSPDTVLEALHRENIASDLAEKAAKMEDAIVTGGEIPAGVMQLLGDSEGKVRSSLMDEARASSTESATKFDNDEDFHEFVTNRKKWMNHYQEVYGQKVKELKSDEVVSR